MSFYKLFNSCQIEAFGLTEILTCPELEAGLFPTADFFFQGKNNVFDINSDTKLFK